MNDRKDGPLPESQPIKKASHSEKNWYFLLGLMPFVFVAGLGLGYILWGRNNSSSTVNVAIATSTPSVTQATKRYDVPVGNNPYLGSENAAVTIIEFGDYECPYCKEWYLQVYPQIMSAYSGKIRFVFRDFPLSSIHADALPAAEAADCAGEQGKYWAFHDKLLSGGLTLGMDAYTTYAKNLGLNLDTFNTCVQTNKYENQVETNVTFATNLGIQSTPTFFINGIAVVGAQSFDVFKQIIDQELSKQ